LDRVHRQLLEEAAPDRVREALDVIGRYGSGRADVSERHDEHLADAYGS
jgi:hypothetical protein